MEKINGIEYKPQNYSHVLVANHSDQKIFSQLMLADDKKDKISPLDIALKDGHLTDKEAIDHYLNGSGETARVGAKKLHIYQKDNFNSDNWAKGVVQGDDDFKVHGKVDLYKQLDGSVEVHSQKYDYGWEAESALLRNIGTVARGALIGNGTEYKIEYYNSPKITREGNGYTEKLFGN